MPSKPSIPPKDPGDNVYASEINALTDHFENKADVDGTMGVCVHGATAGTARPDYAIVTWIGSVEPTNATDNDIWWNTASVEQIPLVAGTGTFSATGTPKTYTVNLAAASVGDLMVVALYNSGTDTAYTPPAGWDNVHTAYGMSIYTRVKQGGDADTFAFTSDQSTSNGLAALYISGADYTNTSSLTIGTLTSISSNTGKTITGISLAKPALVLAFITGSNAAPNGITSDFELVGSYPEPASAFRYMNVYKKGISGLSSGDVAYTFAASASNGGILVAFYS